MCKKSMLGIKKVTLHNQKIDTFDYCGGGNGDTPSINNEIFLDVNMEYGYWASSGSNGRDVDNGGTELWQLVSFRFGAFNNWIAMTAVSSFQGYILPVRSSPNDIDEKISALFSKQLEPYRQEQNAIAAKEKAQADREAEQQRKAKAETEKQRQAEERIFNSVLSSKDPQAMYLGAGKYQRNGESWKAQQIYERLVDRFPSSPFAVKASDQLSENKRVNEASNAVQSAVDNASQNARELSYQQCKNEETACYSRTNGKGNCYRGCNNLR